MSIYTSIYNGEKFLIATGMTATVRFTGREFPRNEPGGRAKTHRLNDLYNGMEAVIVNNPGLSATAMKERLRLLASGEDTPSSATLHDMLRRFADTKTAKNTRTAYLCTARNVLVSPVHIMRNSSLENSFIFFAFIWFCLVVKKKSRIFAVVIGFGFLLQGRGLSLSPSAFIYLSF